MPTDDSTSNSDVVNTFKFRASVARTSFLDMYMAQDGIVLSWDLSPKLIIEDRTLKTGLAPWAQFANNGVRERVYRSQLLMMEFPDLFRAVQKLSDPLEKALLYMGEKEEHDNLEMVLENSSTDLNRPFVDAYVDFNKGVQEREWVYESMNLRLDIGIRSMAIA